MLRTRIVLFVLAVLLGAMIVMASGCMTTRGFLSDLGDVCRAGEHYLDPVEQGRQAR